MAAPVLTTRSLSPVVYVGLAVGAALLTALIAYQGFGQVVAALARMGGGGLVVLTLFHLTTILAHAIAWRQLLQPVVRLPTRTLMWARWIAESVNDLLPVLQIGGNVVRARLLSNARVSKAGVSGAVAGASVVVDITMNLVAQLLYAGVGLCLLVSYIGGDSLV